MLGFLADIDGNTIGLGGLSGALVIAMGYMLRDRRDTDKRVDRATTVIIDTIKAERDRAIKDHDDDRVKHEREQHELRSKLDGLAGALDDERERNRILQFRLGLKEIE